MKPTTPHLFCFGLGYTGLKLAHRLLGEGWQVSGTVRDVARLSDTGLQGVDTVVFDGDDSDAPDVCAALDRATHVLSTVPPDDNGDPVLRVMADALKQRDDLQWIGYLSTTGVYGDTGGCTVDEQAPTNPSGPRGARRMVAEKAWLAVHAHIFRLPGIYGPGRSAFDQARAGQARRIAKPGHMFNRIHVDDIVETLMASMARPNAGAIYNVCDDVPAAPADVTAYACDLMGIEPPPLVQFEDAAPDMSPMALSFWCDNRRVSNARIKHELGVRLHYADYRAGLDAIWRSEAN